MPVPSRGAVPAEDQVVLLCPSKVQQVVNGVCLGITPDAFRVDDDGISVTWVEYFQPPPPALEQAAGALKKAREPSASGVLAHANVGRILEVAGKLKLLVGVIHTPIEDNEGHASITGWTDDLGALLALSFAFSHFTPNKSVKGFYGKAKAQSVSKNAV